MSATTPPKAKLTYADYALIPDDGCRHEIIDGEHHVNPAPDTAHQTASKRLQFELYTKFELRGLGVAFCAPYDVQLSDHDIVQPDLVVVLNAKRDIITPSRIVGVPDLLVEILSPSSLRNDRIEKFERYRQAGVPEYWIVDPHEHTLEQFVLRDGAYQLLPPSDEVRPTIVEGVAIRVGDLW